ncbi:MAG: hypothetical protein ABMA64_05530 [Myxococcota bacterium]
MTVASSVGPPRSAVPRPAADAFGLSLLDPGSDRSFLNHARINVEGTGYAPDLGPYQAVVQFTDPFSGRTFTAWSSFPQADEAGASRVDAAGDVVELSSSGRMFRKANPLAERCADATLPEDQASAACAELVRYTADLDVHLEMFTAFDR